jgi:hypothetical protein
VKKGLASLVHLHILGGAFSVYLCSVLIFILCVLAKSSNLFILTGLGFGRGTRKNTSHTKATKNESAQPRGWYISVCSGHHIIHH